VAEPTVWIWFCAELFRAVVMPLLELLCQLPTASSAQLPLAMLLASVAVPPLTEIEPRL
jgi:hypothetical protein